MKWQRKGPDACGHAKYRNDQDSQGNPICVCLKCGHTWASVGTDWSITKDILVARVNARDYRLNP